MLHTILRNTPVTLLVIGALLSGILSVATAETADRNATSTTKEPKTTTRVNLLKNKDESNAKRKAFQAHAAELRTNAKARKEALTARMAERRARISEKVEKRVRTVVANMRSRISGAIERLDAVADHIESRARKIEGQGVNVSSPLALVAQARVELRAAGVIINDDLSAEVDAAVTAEEPKASFEYVKESVREAHGHVKTAQKALRDAVAALKAAVATQKSGGVHEAVTDQ